MGIFTIKDHTNDFYAKVDDEGNLYVKTSGGGSLTDVNIFDSAGNPLTSTGGALDVNSGGIGWANFGQGTPDIVSVGPTTTILLNANPDRVYASFTNNSNFPIYLRYAISAVWQRGQLILPNSGWEILTTGLFLGQVSAITNGATVDIDVIEGVV